MEEFISAAFMTVLHAHEPLACRIWGGSNCKLLCPSEVTEHAGYVELIPKSQEPIFLPVYRRGGGS